MSTEEHPKVAEIDEAQLRLMVEGRFETPEGELVDTEAWREEADTFHEVEVVAPSIETLDWVSLDSEEFATWWFMPPESVLWDQFQTPIRNQRNRNTCSAFCMVAAIEARYRRDHSVQLDLSEQFFWHLYKSASIDNPLRYKYENQSSFWGGGNSHGLRSAVNFMICEDVYAPYLDRQGMIAVRDSIAGTGQLDWSGDPATNTNTQAQVDAFEYSTQYISDTARSRARYGVESYQLLNQTQVRATRGLEWIIGGGHEVLLDLRLNWRNDNGVMRWDSTRNGGAHCFLVVGYDRSDQVFFVKNSWGEPGFIKIGYDLVENAASSGSYITSVRAPGSPTHKGKYVGRWHMDHDGWEGTLTIRRTTPENNQLIRLGHYERGGDVKAVHGRFENATQGLEFSIEPAPYPATYNMTGQRFDVDIFSNSATMAAGTTSWNSTPFGVQLLRVPWATPVRADDNTFEPADWIGTWDMRHDGWIGQLVVTSVRSQRNGIYELTASYRDSRGTTRQVRGGLLAAMSHAARIDIRFGGGTWQSFELFVHTWDTVRFSGTTIWGGRDFGVIGVRHS